MAKVKHIHTFILLNDSQLAPNKTDKFYYYTGDFKTRAECISCGKQVSHKTIIKLLNKYIGNKK